MRVLLCLLIGLAALVYGRGAEAAVKDCGAPGTGCNYAEAYAYLVDFQSRLPTQCEGTGCGNPRPQYSYAILDQATNQLGLQRTTTPGGALSWRAAGFYSGGKVCPTGEEVDPAGGCRCVGGFMRESSGQCLTSAKCQARNDSLGNAIAATQGSTNGCFGGCAMSMGTDYETRLISQGALERTIFRGQMRYTGASCSTPTKAPDDATPECTPMTGTLTICVKPDGQFCGKGSNGRLACWRPGETGEKTDGPDKHIRQPGPTHTPPNLQQPNGDTLIPNGSPVVDRSTGKPGTTYNGPVTNNTTNYASYSTQSGANAGPTNQGENGNGDGGGKEGDGDGEGEGEDGSAGGGATCDAPPQCSGDPVNCAVLDQSWRVRCGTTKGDANGDGRADWTDVSEGETGEGIEPGNGEEKAKSWGLEGLLDNVNDSGFIGGSCPQLPMFELGPLGSFDPNGAWWCDVLELIGGVFVFVASCNAVRILVS